MAKSKILSAILVTSLGVLVYIDYLTDTLLSMMLLYGAIISCFLYGILSTTRPRSEKLHGYVALVAAMIAITISVNLTVSQNLLELSRN